MGGEAAASAAQRLLWLGRIDVRDPRLDAILLRASPHCAAFVLGSLVEHRPLAELRGAILRVLGSDDVRAGREVLEDLELFRVAGRQELLAASLAAGRVAPVLLDAVRLYAGEPSDAELYWQDAPNEDEDDDEP